MSLVVLLTGLVGALRGTAVIARHRAAAAADFAALAGAVEAVSGRDTACAAARSVAAENGGELVQCTVAGSVVTVRVDCRLAPPLARWRAQGRSRAGPAP
ncbi:MAG TPA: Rv3654c family TadE-like protein [Mycobacteriales bacterium]|nr:Rv3654c family TadE-like protein [Mycobacteriales bacterium]